MGRDDQNRKNFRPRIVAPAQQSNNLAKSSRQALGTTEMFDRPREHYFMVLNVPRVSDHEFRKVIADRVPIAILDLRRAPRFDIGTLNRAKAFEIFRLSNSLYIDFFARYSEARDNDLRTLTKMISSKISELIHPLLGPILFLVDDKLHSFAFTEKISESLETMCGSAWDFEYLPVFSTSAPTAQKVGVVGNAINERGTSYLGKQRQQIFISHANPEENTFVSWLSSRLMLAGYSVWSDVNNLIGGELFWNEIEDTIRNRSQKVIFVQSETSLRKANALNELDLALDVERTIGISNFVIPVRVDDSEFGKTYIGLRRRLFIDFKEGWSSGLASLVARLEKDGVARSNNPRFVDRRSFAIALRGASSTTVRQPSTLWSNWFEYASVPNMVRFYEVENLETSAIPNFVRSLALPAFPIFRLIGTFADWPTMKEAAGKLASLKPRAEIPVSKYSKGVTGDLPKQFPRETRAQVVFLLRSAWNETMRARGLVDFELSGGRRVWFLSKDLVPEGSVKFSAAGKTGRRQLVGYSEKYKVYWHFSAEMRPDISVPWRAILKPSVIFTTDGKNSVMHSTIMHRLRRSFCKNWWNGRWRDLLLAYMGFLGDGDDEIHHPSHCLDGLSIRTSPTIFASPVSVGEKIIDPYNVYLAATDDDEPIDLEDLSEDEQARSETTINRPA